VEGLHVDTTTHLLVILDKFHPDQFSLFHEVRFIADSRRPLDKVKGAWEGRGFNPLISVLTSPTSVFSPSMHESLKQYNNAQCCTISRD